MSPFIGNYKKDKVKRVEVEYKGKKVTRKRYKEISKQERSREKYEASVKEYKKTQLPTDLFETL